MSEELLDEISAINSIYGEGTLGKSSDGQDDYILSLPGDSVSLRLQLSSGYPDEPPIVLGTYSSGEHGRRGAASRDLTLFRQAVGEVYEPGQVCLFDAIEKLKEHLETQGEEDERQPEITMEHHPPALEAESLVDSSLESLPKPPWTLSDPVTELKSTFIARCAAVKSPAQAAQFVQHLLAADKKVRSATHNITAWRIRGPNGTSFQDCDDDGETAAGGRLLHLMQLMDLWDTMVIVTRWYGGQKLGPRRFALINAAARDAFVKAGFVDDPSTKKKGHGK